MREHAGEEPAEYLMSCIASVPLTELATKDSVERLEQRFDAELPKLATKDSVEALKDSVSVLNGRVERLEAVCVGLDAKFEADRARRDAQREADRKEAARRHWLMVAAAVLVGAEIIAAEAGWLGWFTDLLASVL